MSIQSVFNDQALAFAKPTIAHFANLEIADRNRVADFCLTKINNTHKPVADMDTIELAKFNANLLNRVKTFLEKEGCDKIISTNGLQIDQRMMKVYFERYENIVKAYVKNANTNTKLTEFGDKYISRKMLRDMPEEAYDSMVFNEAAFNLFGLSIYGS